jgi:hypothetical protein
MERRSTGLSLSHAARVTFVGAGQTDLAGSAIGAEARRLARQDALTCVAARKADTMALMQEERLVTSVSAAAAALGYNSECDPSAERAC